MQRLENYIILVYFPLKALYTANHGVLQWLGKGIDIESVTESGLLFTNDIRTFFGTRILLLTGNSFVSCPQIIFPFDRHCHRNVS